MRVRGLRAVVALIALMASVLVVTSRAPAAMAADPACPSPEPPSHAFAGWYWNPASGNYVNGIRAPIRLRRDGLLCILQPGETEGAFTALTIGIGNPNGGNTAIAQIGFIHDFNADGNPEWCRFWFNPYQRTAQDYMCTDNDNQQVYFEVQTYLSGTNAYYGIYDCGTGGDFSNCTVKNGNTPAFAADQALAFSEADYQCTIQMLGQNSDRVWFGNSNWATSINDNSGWQKNRNWIDLGGSCTRSYMKENDGDGLLRTWDSRNTS